MQLKAKFERRPRCAEPRTASPRQRDEKPAVTAAARNLALAHHIDRLIERGIINDYSQAARMLGVSQPRMTHLMGLLLLSPAVQESILLGKIAPRDKELRELARVAEWEEQDEALPQRRAVRPGRGD